MNGNISVGIDVGSNHVKVVVSERSSTKEKKLPKIIATGHTESKGLHHGYIVNVPDVTECVRQAINEAEKMAKIKIKKVFLSVGGIGLESISEYGSAIVSRGDGQITKTDVEKAIEAAEKAIPQQIIANRSIVNTAIPLSYKIDGKEVLGGNPVGMKGLKIDAKVFFVTCFTKQLTDLVSAVEDAGLEVIDVLPAPLAASVVNLNKVQKMAGCVLANIGAETLSVVVFENGLPVSLEVFPIGSNDITNDIALGLRVSLEEAENIKKGALTNSSFTKKDLDRIIVSRISDMFDLVEAHLKKIGRSGLLPAGVILTGGGSSIHTIEEMAKVALRLPSKLGGLPTEEDGRPIKDSSWSVAYGLSIWGFTGNTTESSIGFEKPAFGGFVEELKNWFKSIIHPFLP